MPSSFRYLLFLSIVVAPNVIIIATLRYDDNNYYSDINGRELLGTTEGVQITPSSSNKYFSLSSSEMKERNKDISNIENDPYAEEEEQQQQSASTETSSVKLSSQTIKSSTWENLSQINDTFSTERTAASSETSLVTTRHSIISPSLSAGLVPYYLKGKTKYKKKKFHHKRTFKRIENEEAKPIGASQKVWVLQDPVKLPTRNHESILLEYNGKERNDKQILVNVLGRYSRSVQWLNLETGEQRSVETKGTDPDQRPLNDLNHVASVVVDSLDRGESDDNTRKRKEVWLPCGFHNDRIGKELSSNYVRIVDLETMQVRTGPKLPFSGGACGAAPIEAVSGEPPVICAFGGTNGNHDTGIFLPYVSCYDRISENWVYPFGKLPVGMDHLSVAVVPKAACHPDDPARVLVFNFRTKNYSTHTSAEILAFDIPKNGWTREELERLPANEEGHWYTFANHTFSGGEDEAYAPRDASGVAMANGGRSVINFGGINQIRNPLWKKKGDLSNGPKVFSTWYSTVRELKVCSKTWKKVADLGIQTFALMASASTKLNTAFFCGGSMYRQDFNGNTRLCLAIKIPGIKFWNHRTAAVENFPPGFEAGGEVAETIVGGTVSTELS
eukprot:CAMPEP_0168164700 /NCGR_PEP_ID=MMETSP0139_2-20121125/1084_1 /TAXON_ID=44445 /ORGANISM="Pseudo-nitzschia australis, Strain 10249 10 AB" /LENGTH=614 /DNA_ID=CAMNT_0008081749 /DNA_START=407 /DNA_END=2251 /DNA_ORIENTATION=+